VAAALLQADARHLPLATAAFDSASCFLGLQDIEIEFGAEDQQEAVAEVVRVLRPGRVLTLLDELSSERFEALLQGLPVAATELGACALGIHWSREVAECTVALYAAGWALQPRLADRLRLEHVREEAYRRMAAEMEHQLASQGYNVPFGPVRMIVARKAGDAPKSTAIRSA
jgi:ubiquinone/menaquinone biosynthesis C-methylase UbiE